MSTRLTTIIPTYFLISSTVKTLPTYELIFVKILCHYDIRYYVIISLAFRIEIADKYDRISVGEEQKCEYIEENPLAENATRAIHVTYMQL